MPLKIHERNWLLIYSWYYLYAYFKSVNLPMINFKCTVKNLGTKTVVYLFLKLTWIHTCNYKLISFCLWMPISEFLICIVTLIASTSLFKDNSTIRSALLLGFCSSKQVTVNVNICRNAFRKKNNTYKTTTTLLWTN